jgi:uncharacterized protein (DUF2147 family)
MIHFERNLQRLIAAGLAALFAAGAAHAQQAGDAQGLWLTAQKDAVIEFKSCPEPATALCGTIVWDSEATAKPQANDCGVRVVQVLRFDNGAWRDGWAYDPRDKKQYKANVRVKDGTLRIRAYIGSEILGQTEVLTRTDKVPAGCAAR